MKRAMGVSLLCGLLAACATSNLDRLQPGSIGIDEMRSKEKPTAEWKNADGSTTLEYSVRPSSQRNVMLDFDAKGVLREARFVATRENMALLKTGMSRAEVQRIIGSPVRVLKDSQSGGDLWEVALEAPAGADSPQAVILVYWHPRVDGAIRIVEGNRFE